MLETFEYDNNYKKIAISKLPAVLYAINSNLLIVWLDEDNIFYIEHSSYKNEKIVLLAKNPFIGFKESLNIKAFFKSFNTPIYRTLNIEDAIAFSIKNKQTERDFQLYINFNDKIRNTLFSVGDGVIEMGTNNGYPSTEYSIKLENSLQCLGFVFKGLRNQCGILNGTIKDMLLLNCYGYNIKLNDKTLIDKDNIIPNKYVDYYFLQDKSVNKQFELSINNEYTNDIILNFDAISTFEVVSYIDAIDKSKHFFVCNASGQILNVEPISASEISEDRQFYQFKSLGNSYIPREWLRISDINNQVIESTDILFCLKVEINIDANSTIKIELNNHEIKLN